MDRETYFILTDAHGSKTFLYSPLNLNAYEWKAFVRGIETNNIPIEGRQIVRETFLLEKCHHSMQYQ